MEHCIAVVHVITTAMQRYSDDVSSPVFVLDSPGAGPVELERGGILLLLLFEFFSMFVSV